MKKYYETPWMDKNDFAVSDVLSTSASDGDNDTVLPGFGN